MFFYFKKYLKSHLLLILVLIISGIAEQIISLSFNYIINGIILFSGNQNDVASRNLVIIWSCIAVAAFFLYPFLVYKMNCFMVKLAYLVAFDLRVKIINSIQTYQWLEFNQKGPSTFLGWILNDINLLTNGALQKFYATLREVTVIFFGLIFLIIIDYHYFIYFSIGLLTLLFFIISPFLFNKFIKKSTTKYLAAQNTFSQKLTNFLEGYQILLFANKLNILADNIGKICLKMKKKEFVYDSKNNTPSLINTSVSSLLMTSIIIGGVFLALNGFLTFGSLIAANALIYSIISSSSEFVSGITDYTANKHLIKKSYASLEKDNKTKLLNESINKIELNKVNFQIDKKTIIENFSCIFLANKKYALIATSGKGKSTLIRLILGVYNGYEGSITINDQEVKIINNESLFNQVGYVTNETNLLPGSVKDNIIFDSETVDDAKLELALTKAQLIDEVNLNDNSDKLSTGQKQRVILARLFYWDKPVWILDEATANLDKINRQIIEREIIEDPNKLVIMISHNFDEDIKSKFDHIINL